MVKYILKKLGSVIITLFILSIVLFGITHSMSGDPASVILGTNATPEAVAELRESMGLNDPIIVQYGSWLLDCLHGDLGDSYFRNESVVQSIVSCFAVSINLAVFAELLALVFAVPLGILAAMYRNRFPDIVVSVVSHIFLAIPAFVLALVLSIVFGGMLKILPVSGYRSMQFGFGMHIEYLLLPAISLACRQGALIARMTRSSMVEVMSSDYVKTAKAKGLSKGVITFKHALKNSLNTIITVVGQSFGEIIANVDVTETIFAIPGVGQLLISSISKRDYPEIQGVVLVISLMYCLINVILDLAYSAVDPRIRTSK